MSGVEHQLREYFDASVERISVDDVIAHAEVQEDLLQPLRSRRTLKPAWAAVGAFAATIVGLGGFSAALKLSERVAGEFGAGGSEIVATDGGTLGIWLIAAFVAALAAAGVTWLIRRPAEQPPTDQEDQGKVMVMETIEDTDREVGATKEVKNSSRWPIVLVVVLAIAVAGLVAWMTLAMRPNSPNAAPAEIVQLMEDYNAAWNAYDADALAGLVTDGYRIYGPEAADFDHDFESLRTYLMPLLEDWDWEVTAPGPIYAVNISGSTWAVSGEGSTITRNGIEHEQNAVWTVVDRDGEFLVSEHYMVGG